MIVFESVRWKNLLSTGNAFTVIQLNRHKTTLVVGENGSGKSTMLDAISFALFGKPFRRVNKPQLINSINKKGLLVELTFVIGSKRYLVRRGLKPNIFEVYSDGFLLNQEADSRDYQEILETQILKFNHKSFTQIIAAGSALFVPFMQLPTSHRREIVEDLLDIQIFSVMNNLLKKDIELNRQEISDTQQNINLVQQKIDLNKSYIESHKKSVKEKLDQRQENIARHQEEIELKQKEYEHFIKEFEVHKKKHQQKITLDGVIRELKQKISQQKEQYKTEIKNREFFNQNKSCPLCMQDIAHNHKEIQLHEYDEKIEILEKNIAGLVKRYDEVIKEQNEIGNVEDQMRSVTLRLNSVESDIKISQKLIQQMQQDVTALEQDDRHKEELEQQIKDAENQLKAFLERKETLFKDRQVLEITSELLKDTGIKTKIIKQYIPIMNKLINKYLASMDFFVNFELNENFEESIKSRFRDEFSYQNFSEGEKARLDIALLFTWRAIAKLRNSASTNLLVMDEIFDSSLDLNGSEELLKIITTLADDSNIFVISHKTDQMIDKFERVIRFEKHKNFSRMIAS